MEPTRTRPRTQSSSFPRLPAKPTPKPRQQAYIVLPPSPPSTTFHSPSTTPRQSSTPRQSWPLANLQRLPSPPRTTLPTPNNSPTDSPLRPLSEVEPSPSLPVQIDILPQQDLNLALEAQRRYALLMLTQKPKRSFWPFHLRASRGPDGQPLPRGRQLPIHENGVLMLRQERHAGRRCLGKRRSTWCIVCSVLMAIASVVPIGILLWIAVGSMVGRGQDVGW